MIIKESDIQTIKAAVKFTDIYYDTYELQAAVSAIQKGMETFKHKTVDGIFMESTEEFFTNLLGHLINELNGEKYIHNAEAQALNADITALRKKIADVSKPSEQAGIPEQKPAPIVNNFVAKLQKEVPMQKPKGFAVQHVIPKSDDKIDLDFAKIYEFVSEKNITNLICVVANLRNFDEANSESELTPITGKLDGFLEKLSAIQKGGECDMGFFKAFGNDYSGIFQILQENKEILQENNRECLNDLQQGLNRIYGNIGVSKTLEKPGNFAESVGKNPLPEPYSGFINNR